jgi:hypothetical protein
VPEKIKFTKQYKLRRMKGNLMDEPKFFDRHLEEQNEIADYLFGMVARRDGKPLDRTKSEAWQRGWAEAQE